ncbi:hypothetical protein CDEST_02603 [Colletotrichum destructivum]|uniref:Uncharacterized protein n=1 Tax=Colletotrichum destructivum TaxID=34406 RepID=A0AAX4I3J7_9PEZI|nr:hypothetical protein CDEST_02603 [Colletotrichum destructivum]
MTGLRTRSVERLHAYHGASVKVREDLGQVYFGLPHGFWNMFLQADFCKKHQRDTKSGLQ